MITYDRRGFGQSSQPTIGYEYDTFAADLRALVEHLELSDFVLVGFSMGTGEVTRYLGAYGSVGVSKAVLMGEIPRSCSRPMTTPRAWTGRCSRGSRPPSWPTVPPTSTSSSTTSTTLTSWAAPRISDQAWQNSFIVAVAASAHAAYACVDTWLTDFRHDLPRIDIPVLLVHGDADRILPYASTAARLPDLIRDLTLVTVEGGPHNIAWTHPEIVNPALLDFLRKSSVDDPA